MESLDRVDEILNSLKLFYSHLGQIIENGYNNDINDLEYLHEIVDTFYSSGDIENSDNNEINELSYQFSPSGECLNYNLEPSMETNETDTEIETETETESETELDLSSILSSDVEFIDNTSEINQEYEQKTPDFIDKFYGDNFEFNNIIIFNNSKKRLNNFFIY